MRSHRDLDRSILERELSTLTIRHLQVVPGEGETGGGAQGIVISPEVLDVVHCFRAVLDCPEDIVGWRRRGVGRATAVNPLTSAVQSVTDTNEEKVESRQSRVRCGLQQRTFAVTIVTNIPRWRLNVYQAGP